MIDQELKKQLMESPHKFICDWMEENLLHVGRRAFKIISLMPCSMIIPSIPFNSSDIRSNINVFIIGAPASGKSTLTKVFDRLSYSPVSLKGTSARKLIQEMNRMDGFFSLSIDDFSNILDQPDGYEIIKILESALGDEKRASHQNMNYKIDLNTSALGLICGTWTDLKRYSNYLKGGFLSRTSLLFISINEKQREEIADFINRGIGNRTSSEDSKIKEKLIKEFYNELFDIQAKKNKIPQITGYNFNNEYKGIALNKWKILTREYANDINGDFKRELQDFYRFVVSFAFLNIHNRDYKEGILTPSKEDYESALNLMVETLTNKIVLIKTRLFLREIDSPSKLLEVLKNPNIKEDVRNILLNLSSIKTYLKK